MGIKIKGFNRVASYSGLLLAAFFGLMIFPISLAIDSTEATVTPSTTTLTLSTSDISAEITPNNANGTFVASDPATVSVTTNNYSGYTLGITSSDNVNNTKLINTDDNTAYLTSISSASAPADFNVGNWGYLPSKLNGTANSAYQPAPTTTATTLEATNAANPTANEYTVALGIKADYSLSSGTYENTFNITAVANPVAYAITYDKNTTDTVTNMPANLIGDTTATTVTISNLVPQRTNYTFLGWNTAADGSGTTYNPNGGGTDLTYDLNQTTTNNDTLYAMWEVACNQSATTISNAVCLQDINTSVQNSMTTGTTYQLLDSRDGTNYHLAKLADGRVWLLDNLALDLTDSTVLDNVTAANTNASATSLNYLKNGGGTTSDQYAVSGVSNWTSGYSYSDPLVNMTNKDVIPDNAPTNGKGYNKVGGYYNFCATSAGSYCYGNGTSYNTSSGNATEDICPAGWRLPTSNTGEYGALANAIYGSTSSTSDATQIANFRNALSLPLSGGYIGGSAYDQGSIGYFRSSTRYTDSFMYNLYVDTSSIDPSYGYGRSRGFAIRCIAERPDATITFNANGGSGTMSSQTLTKGTGTLNSNAFTREGYAFTGWNTAANGSGTSYANGATYTGTSTTLYAQWQKLYIQNFTTATCPTTATVVFDNRDETPYHIQKLADGKCWMLDNLALDLTNSTVKSKLSASNTNATATSISRLINGGGTTSDKYATAGVANWTSSYSYSAPLVSMASKDVVPDNAPTGGAGYNKVGGYYNFCAASAGSYCYGDGTSVGTSSGNATEDICPKNWRMPTGNTGEYSALANAIYGSTGSTSDATQVANFRNALSLPFSGYFNNGSADSQGNGGYFWSSTRRNNNYMYRLGVVTSVVGLSDYNYRSAGHSVRCLAGV